MNYYSQRNLTYKNIKLGTCTNTLYSHGCFCCALSMIAYNDPVETNKLFTVKGGYSNGCMVNSDKAAELLELRYDGRSTKKPNHICIAETGHYKTVGVPQHFFVFAPKGTVSDVTDLMLDPLDNPSTMSWKPVKYNIVRA